MVMVMVTAKLIENNNSKDKNGTHSNNNNNKTHDLNREPRY